MEAYIIFYVDQSIFKTNDLSKIPTSSNISKVVRISDMSYYLGDEWIPIIPII